MGLDGTKSVLNALIVIAGQIEEQMRDGFQWTDIPEAIAKIQGDAEKKQALADAIKAAPGVLGEYKNLDAMALVPLAIDLVPKIQKLIADAQKK